MDSSAYVKLPLREPEQEALRAELGGWDGYISSALLSVEAPRACARYGEEYAAAASAGLSSISLLPIDDELLERARAIQPGRLRTLEAIHLATALSIADDLGVLLSYDERLADAARAAGLAVASPG